MLDDGFLRLPAGHATCDIESSSRLLLVGTRVAKSEGRNPRLRSLALFMIIVGRLFSLPFFSSFIHIYI